MFISSKTATEAARSFRLGNVEEDEGAEDEEDQHSPLVVFCRSGKQ